MGKAPARTCKSRYEAMESFRQPFLDRARRCSELTIPTLIPPQSHSPSVEYYTPWQGVGARGVNNLASKLLLSLLPPNAPFFRLTIDDFTLEKLAGQEGARAKVESGLNKYERAVQADIEGSGMRSPIFLALKHLITGGNALVYLPIEGIRVFGLDSYVASRDPKGNLLEVIIKEVLSEDVLEDEHLELLSEGDEIEAEKEGSKDEEKNEEVRSASNQDDTVEVYTRFYRDGKRWKMYQEIKGNQVPGSEGSWPLDKCPMLALRWTMVEGEDYGRGYVEEYIGDLISLEGLSKAQVEAAASTAKIVWLVNPNGVTKARDITKAESGAAITGNKEDVHCLQAEKQADMRITLEAIKMISERLSYAFLLHSAVQRQGERVTAEEIRYMASELEDALGGVYSILSQEFQLPFVNRIMDRLQKAKKLPPLPKGVVRPTITTGLDALGRGHDLQKYNTLIQALAPLGEAAMQYINLGDLISRLATGLMIDAKGLVKTDEDIAAEKQQMAQMQQQSQMMDMAGKAAPAAIKAMSDQAMAANQPEAPAEPPAPQGK